MDTLFSETQKQADASVTSTIATVKRLIFHVDREIAEAEDRMDYLRNHRRELSRDLRDMEKAIS